VVACVVVCDGSLPTQVLLSTSTALNQLLVLRLISTRASMVVLLPVDGK
jgi:hypothetical protein